MADSNINGATYPGDFAPAGNRHLSSTSGSTESSHGLGQVQATGLVTEAGNLGNTLTHCHVDDASVSKVQWTFSRLFSLDLEREIYPLINKNILKQF
ncbi:hypothetical protein J6590_032004 [Homalodisca vitripennis]|nr:hypothetical protein J6590_032004 [Homalodisca vitripennis]